jgi:hypothetical protein
MSTTETFSDLDQGAARDLPEMWEKQVAQSNPTVTRTNCDSSVGIAVGLIDGVIASAKALCSMDLSQPETQEALKDLAQQRDVIRLMSSWLEIPDGLIRSDKQSGILLTGEFWEHRRRRRKGAEVTE